MTIHQATTEDIAPLARLFDEYRVFYQYPSDIPGSETFLGDRLSSRDSVIYVARAADDTLMGFVQLYPLLSSVRMKKWICTIYQGFMRCDVLVRFISQVFPLSGENAWLHTGLFGSVLSHLNITIIGLP